MELERSIWGLRASGRAAPRREALRRASWALSAAAFLAASGPALADAARSGRIAPPQISGAVVSESESSVAEEGVQHASLSPPQALAALARRTHAKSPEGAPAARGYGLNVGAAASKDVSPVGRAFDPDLIAEAAAAEERAGPIARPSLVGAELRAALGRAATPLRFAYEGAGFAPVFLGGEGQTAKAVAFLAVAEAAAARHALPAPRYRLDRLAEHLAAAESGVIRDPAAAAAAELAFVRAYLRLATDLSSGAMRPSDFGRYFDLERPRPEASALLLAARRATDAEALAALTDALPPQTQDYRTLLAVYAALRDTAEQGNWPAEVHVRRSLRPFDRGARVDVLRARLVALGDLDPRAPRSVHPETGEALFDSAVEAGVRAFQERHGLAVDGVVGGNTLRALNASAAVRAKQIAVNLERARWFNKPLGERHIIANIPDFHVDVFEGGQSIYRARTVVGAPGHETPEFSDEMTHVVVNPYWNVPTSIAVEEMLPELQEVPGALKRRNINVYDREWNKLDPWSVDWRSVGEGHFPFRLRQEPGEGNALGEVKFIFPNHHAVYLHDTPNKKVFGKPSRAFSHGCVRVAEPRRLAETLLSPQVEDAAAYYRRLTRREGERHVRMKQAVPVHLLYRTAWVDKRGRLQLRDDIYGRDKRMGRALRRAGLVL